MQLILKNNTSKRREEINNTNRQKQTIKSKKVHNAAMLLSVGVCFSFLFCKKCSQSHWCGKPFFPFSHFCTIIKPIVLIVVKCCCSFHFISFKFFSLCYTRIECLLLSFAAFGCCCALLVYMLTFVLSFVSSPKRITINVPRAQRFYSMATITTGMKKNVVNYVYLCGFNGVLFGSRTAKSSFYFFLSRS